MGLKSILKQLAAGEDLLLGSGTAVQERASGPVTVTKLNLVFVASSYAAVRDYPVVDKGAYFEPSPNFQLMVATGKTSAADGQGAIFVWAVDSVAVDDDATVLVPTSAPATGRWIKVGLV